jgi:hypothetical protein
VLYIAVDEETFEDIFRDVSGQVLLDDYGIKVIVVDAAGVEIIRWIN